MISSQRRDGNGGAHAPAELLGRRALGSSGGRHACPVVRAPVRDRPPRSVADRVPAAGTRSPMHMHYGVEEMFFVLSGTLTVRTPEGEEELSPGDVVYFPEGPDGLHTFSNPTAEPARMLGISTKRFPDVVAYPERGVAWVATRHPERPV